MIGFFVFEDTPTLEKPLILAHSSLNSEIKGLFYTRSLDSKDISGVQKGAEFFGVLDDNSGFGSCLFIKDLNVESNTLLLQNNLHVKGDTEIDGNSDIKGSQTVSGNTTINGKLDVTGNIKTSAMITGNSPNTTINLTASHAGLILAAGLSGSAAPLPNVPVIMSNG